VHKKERCVFQGSPHRQLLTLRTWFFSVPGPDLCILFVNHMSFNKGNWDSWIFIFHLKCFFSSKIDGGEYQLINRDGCYSHVSLKSPTNMHVVWVIITYELSTCLRGRVFGSQQFHTMDRETPFRSKKESNSSTHFIYCHSIFNLFFFFFCILRSSYSDTDVFVKFSFFIFFYFSCPIK